MSMATSTIRGIILVAAVVIGVLLIGQAFGSGAGLTLHAASPSPTVSPSPSPSPSASVSTRPALTKKTAVKNVPIQILNASGVNGLGGEVASQLKKQGYNICDTCVETAGTSDLAKTIIYFAPGARDLAGYMEQHYLQGAQLKAAKGLFKAHVKLTVMVGADQSH
jgi:hypothetical protein